MSLDDRLRGGRPGPAVLLRGDMDALPVTEDTGLEFASKVDGAMHACGHDLHTAMLVGAARVLAAHRDELAGDVVFMFQPGEEGWDGASVMIEAAGRRVTAAYGMHVLSSRIPRGMFTLRPGTLLAASDRLLVPVRGQGGHGSAPHISRDPMTGAEDFSRVLDAVPGCYLFLGAQVGDQIDGPDNHSPRATFDDAVLPEGVLLHAQLAVRALRRA